MRHMLPYSRSPTAAAPAQPAGPTLVLHGMADKMVHVSGGRSTAAAVPGAELLLIDGMGHDLPPELFETLVEAIRVRPTARPHSPQPVSAASGGRDERGGELRDRGLAALRGH